MNVVGHTADVTTWSADGCDAVLCVFGVFFLPDMDAGAAHLSGRARPGGRIAVTTWVHGSVGPLVDPFTMAAEAERAAAGAAVAVPNRSRSASGVSSADGLAGWLADVGACRRRGRLIVPYR